MESTTTEAILLEPSDEQIDLSYLYDQDIYVSPDLYERIQADRHPDDAIWNVVYCSAMNRDVEESLDFCTFTAQVDGERLEINASQRAGYILFTL